MHKNIVVAYISLYLKQIFIFHREYTQPFFEEGIILVSKIEKISQTF